MGIELLQGRNLLTARLLVLGYEIVVDAYDRGQEHYHYFNLAPKDQIMTQS